MDPARVTDHISRVKEITRERALIDKRLDSAQKAVSTARAALQAAQRHVDTLNARRSEIDVTLTGIDRLFDPPANGSVPTTPTNAASPTRAAVAPPTQRQRILAAMEGVEECTSADVSERTGIPRASVDADLYSAAGRGLVEKIRPGVFRLPRAGVHA